MLGFGAAGSLHSVAQAALFVPINGTRLRDRVAPDRQKNWKSRRHVVTFVTTVTAVAAVTAFYGSLGNSLSCQRCKDILASAVTSKNSAMPVRVIRISAANRRGMLSCNPAIRIW